MAGESMHIDHQLGFSGCSGGATHAAAQRDADAGGATDEGAEHQFIASLAFHQPIKAGPIEIGHVIADQRSEISHICDRIGLACRQCVCRLAQLEIAFGRLKVGIGRKIIHG